MSVILLNSLGIILLIAIVYWFWLSEPKQQKRHGTSPIAITVADGVYEPAHISAAAAQPLTLEFTRMDPTPCAAMVIFPSLDLSYELPLDTPFKVELPALAAGEYPFHCQMNMYRGDLKIQ